MTPVAELSGLTRRFGQIRALDGVDLSIGAGELVALVGESGSGKSSLARVLMGLDRGYRGAARLWGRELRALGRADRRRIGVVFQDPFGSLDPTMTLGRIVSEPLEVHRAGGAQSRAERSRELLEAVGLNPDWAGRRPDQLSGGQRQRVAIARAIALEPDLLIMDEPVSALDVSVQAQVLNLLADLHERMGFAALFISHDLAVVRHVAHRVAVLYLGRIVEEAPADRLFAGPEHPYTISLLSSAEDLGPAASRRIRLAGDPPSPIDLPPGCRFHPRCFRARPDCATTDPGPIGRSASPGQVSCLHPGGLLPDESVPS